MAEIQNHFVLLCNELNVDSILPLLRQKKMLTADEYEQLAFTKLTLREKRERLLLLLPRKGSNHYYTFCCCLVWSGQRELARKMGVHLNSIPSLTREDHPPSQPPPPPTHSTSQLPPPSQPPPSHPPPPSEVPYHPQNRLPPHPLPHQTQPPVTIGAPPLPTSFFPSRSVSVPDPTNLSRASPSIPPLTTKPHPLKVLIIYSKDTELQRVPTLHPTLQISPEDFCSDVENLADTLSVLSSGPTSDGTRCFECLYDKYDTPDSSHRRNWFQWFDSALDVADCVLLVCSPLLASSLAQQSGSLEMARGMCNISSLVNCMPRKCFIPVFLNMPKQSAWIPLSLQAADTYELNIREFHQLMGNTEGMREDQFAAAVPRCFQAHSQRLNGLNSLLQVLRREHTLPPHPAVIGRLPPIEPPRVPYQMPSHQSLIPNTTLVEIATLVVPIWEHLGVKLGVPFSKIQEARASTNTFKDAVLMMFQMWQQMKGRDATAKALKEALIDLRYKKVAHNFFPYD